MNALYLSQFIVEYEAPFVTIGSELWENTADNPQKTLDNYYIDGTVPNSNLPQQKF